MHFSVAAGNNGKDACQYSPASASQYGAVVVGSINSDDSLSKFSNYGKCITIYAPGYRILSTSNLDNSSFREMSGTSMAAPHVTGVIINIDIIKSNNNNNKVLILKFLIIYYLIKVMALMLSYKNMTPIELYNTLLNEASTGYIKNLDDESPNKIAYIPTYAIASRCNPLDPYDCIKSLEKDEEDINDDDYFKNNFKSRKNNLKDDYIILQN